MRVVMLAMLAIAATSTIGEARGGHDAAADDDGDDGDDDWSPIALPANTPTPACTPCAPATPT
ncbi:MAG: hypothetical protein NT062_35815, partial [Proteobacteria bacterium]|nr:hypothetical protein [Pseudomonadota bacterium]